MESLLIERNDCLFFYIKSQIKLLCSQPDAIAVLIAEYTIQKYDSTVSTAVDGFGQWHTLYIFRNDGKYAGLQFDRSNKIEKSWIDSINRVWSKSTEFYGFDVIASFYDHKSRRYIWITHDSLDRNNQSLFGCDNQYWIKKYGYSEAVDGPYDCANLHWYYKLKKLTHSGIADITTYPVNSIKGQLAYYIFMNNGYCFVYDPVHKKFLKAKDVIYLKNKVKHTSRKCFNIKSVFGTNNTYFDGFNLNAVWFDRCDLVWYFLKGKQLFQKRENTAMKGPIDIYKESKFYQTLTPSFSNFSAI
eukprot:270411_1